MKLAVLFLVLSPFVSFVELALAEADTPSAATPADDGAAAPASHAADDGADDAADDDPQPQRLWEEDEDAAQPEPRLAAVGFAHPCFAQRSGPPPDEVLRKLLRPPER